jgi:hypothetical protein
MNNFTKALATFAVAANGIRITSCPDDPTHPIYEGDVKLCDCPEEDLLTVNTLTGLY